MFDLDRSSFFENPRFTSPTEDLEALAKEPNYS